MSINSFGRMFRFTTWGESHGPAIGAIVLPYVAVVIANASTRSSDGSVEGVQLAVTDSRQDDARQ